MEYRSQDPDVHIPNRRLDEFVLDAVARFDPARVAVRDADTGVELRYGELAEQVRRVAAAFAERGIGPGDVVGIHLPNGIEFPVVFLAVSACGATATPIATTQTTDELCRQLLIVDAAALVTHASLLGVSGPVAETLSLADGRFVVVGLDGADPARPGGISAAREGAPPATPYEDLLAHAPSALDVAIDPASHPLCLPFSSGTTGMPKPVLLAHRALVANAVQVGHAIGLVEPQRTLAFLPFSHVYTLTTTLICGLVRGDTLVTMGRFGIARALDLLAEEAITLVFIVPPIAAELSTYAGLDPDRLRSLEVIVCGAASLNPTVGRAVCERLGVELLQGYGLSEMAPATHMMRPGAHMPIETVGTALPGVSFRLVDPETRRDVDPPAPGGVSAQGELLVRGPNAMIGYADDPEATAEVLDADGWVHTGDLVTVDSLGQVRVVDRLKEVLKNRGFQVAPAELEALLREYPGVADAAVTGIVGQDDGDEQPFALVVRNVSAGPGPSEEGLLRYVADRTADYKHLVGVAFVEGVPRSEAGKIMRRQLDGLLPADRVPSRASRDAVPHTGPDAA